MVQVVFDGATRTLKLGENTDIAQRAAETATAAAADLATRIETLPIPDPDKSVVIGALGGAELANFDALGLLEVAFGAKKLPIAADDGTVASTITAWSDELSGVKLGIADATTNSTLLALYDDGTGYINMTAPEPSPPAMENVARLRGLRSAMTYLKLGGSALLHIIIDADSWGDDKGYGTSDAIERFFAESGLTSAGPGWIGFASPLSASFSPHGAARLGTITVSRSGTWTNLFLSADTTPGTIQNFPGYDAVQSGADGSIYTIAGSVLATCTSIKLFCEKGGTVEQSWDGTTYTSVTVASGSGSTTATIDMTGKASGSLRLRCTNGTKIAGIYALAASSGVVFSNFSCSGSTAAQKASVQSNADYLATMAAMTADVTVPIVMLSLNDTKAGADNAAIVTNLGTIVAGYRSIFDGYESNDAALIVQPNTALSIQDTLAPLVRTWARDNDAAFVDLQPYFGKPSTSGDYASYGGDYTAGALTVLPLLQAGSGVFRHPSKPSDLIAAGKSPGLSGAMVMASVLSNLLLSPLRSN